MDEKNQASDNVDRNRVDIHETSHSTDSSSPQSPSPTGYPTSSSSSGSGDATITLKKDTVWKGAAFLFAALFAISLFTGGFGFGNGVTGGAVADNPTAPSPTTAPTGQPVQVSLDDDAVKGDPNAPVTIVEFSDYECPFCGRFYSDTLGQIQTEYIDTGKVKLVYRDFPLSFHPQAQKAAEAAECAGEQDKYFEMHDKIFENQQAIGVANLKQYAGELGLNQADFDSCLDSGQMASEVSKDTADGQKYGVRGTPAFFINGQLVSGAQPFSNFKQIIDAELAK